jgi:hypothetical protein
MEIKMNKRRTLIISPHFRPYRSGLSDYSFHFSEELKKHTNIEILSGSGSNDWKGVKLFLRFLKLSQSEADTVLIEYVPYMYGKRGINFQFPILIFLYSLFNKSRIELMVHEYNYPNLGDFKSRILCTSHHIMGKLMLLASDQVFCSTESFVEFLKPKSLCQVEHLPVGSNILKDNISDYKLKELGLKKGEYACLFGSFHPSKDQKYILDELKGFEIPIVHIGVSEEDYQSQDKIESQKIIKTGFLEDKEVAEILANCKVLLTYFVDGATLRRGSLLAGVELGCQVLTNLSSHTEKELISCKNIHFAKSTKEYRSSLKALLEGEPRPFKGQNPFSWKRIISDYLLRRAGR